MAGDSIEGIYETLKRCALLSKYAGGIGLNVSDIRASNSYIAGTGGFSNGLKPLMRVFNDTAKYVDQCFVGHSQVLTNEGYVPISNIKEGDRVFTLNGSFERVLKARKYEFNLTNDDQSPKDLRTIGLAHSSMPVVCTDKHPFLTLRTPDGLTIDWTRGNNVVSSLMDRKILVTEWVEAENLRFSDLIAVPLPQWHETMGPEPTEQQCLDKALSIRHLDHGTQSKFPVDYMSIGGTRLVNFLNGLSTTTSRGYGWVENCSHAFANHVSTLIIKMGYFPRFSNTTQFTTNVGFPSALLTGKVSSHIFINNNVAWVPITHLGLVFSTTCANEDILTVYDLDVDNHHNFLTNGGLAHNGGGKRKGSFALYLEPWHADIETFLDQKQNKKTVKNVAADDGVSSPDLFYGLWVPDLFYKRVISNGTWSTFCPNEAPGLTECYGEEFERKYIEYENTKGLPRKVYKAQDLWRRILSNQIETGTPYMLNKDKCNAKSNQQNLGTIKCSNLCTVSYYSKLCFSSDMY